MGSSRELRSVDWGLRAIGDRVASALVVVEVDERPIAGFLAKTESGSVRLVTALHAVAEAGAVAMRIADGRRLELEHVGAIDPASDLAVFRVPEPISGALVLGGPAGTVEPGELVIVQGQPGDETTLCMSLAGTSEEVSADLSLVLLPALSPVGASGSVVLDGEGEVVGVATRVLSNAGPLAVMVPIVHAIPLLDADGELPLSTLSELPQRHRIERHVPHHPLTVLDGCSRQSLEDIGASIVAAIQVGAPAYNNGEIARCYQVYEECARKLVERSSEAPGPRQALLEGLARAAALDDIDAQAWAMRDTFDGILGLLERWMESRESTRQATPKRKPVLN